MLFSPHLRSKSLHLLHRLPILYLRNTKWFSASVLSDFTRENHDPEPALVSSLKSCASENDASRGRKIHCRVLKLGLDSNTFISNSVLNMYAKCGLINEAESFFASHLDPNSATRNIMVSGYVKMSRLEDARKVFDAMPERDCVSYTTVIMGYAKNDRWHEAMDLFKDMRNAGVKPSEITLVTVISACSQLGGIWDCRMLHCLTIKLQLDGSVLVSTNLLHMYCLCCSLEDARRLFDVMPEKNLVSWNVMLNGYSKAGLVQLARKVFDTIHDKDIVSWGTMIDGYIRKDCLVKAFILFREMLRNGVKPSDPMIVDLLSACGKSVDVREGLQLHGTIVKTGFVCYDYIQATIIHFYAACGNIDSACLQFEASVKDHVASRNALIAGFIKNGMIEQARVLFDETREKDVFTWSTMISGYAQSETPSLALDLFRQMVADGVKPNQITMVSVFSAIASLGSVSEGRRALEFVRRNSITLNDKLIAAIIDMYAKCGSINSAMEFFQQIRDQPSSISPWNAIICGLAMHGRANLCLDLYADLQKTSIKPNSITFIGVLSACCHAGLVEVGERHFESMKSVYNIEPDIKHYGCMVDLLGRAGRLEDAEEITRRMPMKADTVIWGTLLAACRTHGNVEIAKRAAMSLEELEPSHGGCRVLLSNIYADAGKWEDVVLVRDEMQSGRIERLPGLSGVV